MSLCGPGMEPGEEREDQGRSIIPVGHHSSLLLPVAGRSCLCAPAQPRVGAGRGAEHGARLSSAQPLQGAGPRPALEEAVFRRKWDVSSRRWLVGWLPASAAAGGSRAVAERHRAQPGTSGHGEGWREAPCHRLRPPRAPALSLAVRHRWPRAAAVAELGLPWRVGSSPVGATAKALLELLL